jgi:mono/diheme cytochrome c family protein
MNHENDGGDAVPFKTAATGVVGLTFTFLAALHGTAANADAAASKEVRRGEYLAIYGGCGDCHTPKVMTPDGPVPDKSRLLSGHPANAQLPPVPADVVGPGPNKWGALTNGDLTAWVGPWGTSFAANLTPDPQTGLVGWTSELFIKTMRTGKHLGTGRALLPPMPWFDMAVLTDQDLKAVFAYLRSLKPIPNKVPSPVPPK